MTTYNDALAASLGLRAQAIEDAAVAFDRGLTELHSRRPDAHAGTIECADYMRLVEGPKLEWLERVRIKALARAEDDHYNRLAAAGRHFVIENGSRGYASEPAVRWLAEVVGPAA
jgi:hypothetical protein